MFDSDGKSDLIVLLMPDIDLQGQCRASCHHLDVDVQRRRVTTAANEGASDTHQVVPSTTYNTDPDRQHGICKTSQTATEFNTGLDIFRRAPLRNTPGQLNVESARIFSCTKRRSSATLGLHGKEVTS
jgi:hypothetical protein